jgi:hypothetical protein
MITQILAMIVALAMVYFLLRLRYLMLAYGNDKRRYYRAYIAGFDETGLDSSPDDNSENESDTKSAAVACMAGNEGLAQWPSELDLQADAPAYLPKRSTESDPETTVAPNAVLTAGRAND